MDAAAELGRDPVSKHQIQPQEEMSRLTRDGTAEPVSRDRILRHERDREISIFSVQLTTCRTGNFIRLIHTLATCVTIHKTGAVLSSRIFSTIVEHIPRNDERNFRLFFSRKVMFSYIFLISRFFPTADAHTSTTSLHEASGETRKQGSNLGA